MVRRKNFTQTKKTLSKSEQIADEKHARKVAREMAAKAIKSEVPPKGAVLKIEFFTAKEAEKGKKIKSTYIKYSPSTHNAEILFRDPNVKSVTFIGKTEKIIDRKARETKVIEAQKAVEQAEADKEKVKQMNIDRKTQEALPQNRLGISPNERIGRVELILTDKGESQRLSAFEYDITGQKLIEMYEQGLISGIKGAAKAKFTISKAPVQGRYLTEKEKRK